MVFSYNMKRWSYGSRWRVLAYSLQFTSGKARTSSSTLNSVYQEKTAASGSVTFARDTLAIHKWPPLEAGVVMFVQILKRINRALSIIISFPMLSTKLLDLKTLTWKIVWSWLLSSTLQMKPKSRPNTTRGYRGKGMLRWFAGVGLFNGMVL